MEWDADSNRVSFTSSTGGTWEYMYDITAGIPAVIKETGSQYDKTYVREPDGSLIAMFISSYPYYYHFDALGSTRMLTDESGHITDAYHYDAWGNLLTHDPNSISQPYQYVGQIGYYTHYQDSNMTGLLQLGVRFYDPGLGRFGQRDPIERTSRAAYAYSDDRPLTHADPTGRLAGRYKFCGDGKDRISKGCRAIVGCACEEFVWAKAHCCNLDKIHCDFGCNERFPDDIAEQEACTDGCREKFGKCLEDGKAFEDE